MAVIICIENGRECKKCVPMYEAAMMVLRQDMARLFAGQSEEPCRIIGVESGDDDNFIGALLEGDGNITPEEIEKIIQVDYNLEWDERRIRETFKRRKEEIGKE